MTMQQQAPQNPPADAGFKLPAQDGAAPQDPLPKTTPDSARMPVEVAPGGATNPGAAPLRDTSARDLAIAGTLIVALLVIYFFVRNAYVQHLVVRRVSPSAAGSAGWLMYVGLSFLSAAVVLAIVNASKYLTLAITGPLVVVGLVTLVAALFIGRR
jgi:hypothetical protein